MSIAVEIQLNEQQQAALERVARRRKVSLPHVLKSAVDDFIERLEDEELLESSAAAGATQTLAGRRRRRVGAGVAAQTNGGTNGGML